MLLALPSTSAKHMYMSSLINSIDLLGSINTYAGVPSIWINLFYSGAEPTVFTAQEADNNNGSVMLNKWYFPNKLILIPA